MTAARQAGKRARMARTCLAGTRQAGSDLDKIYIVSLN
jgi:hypothetical protein